MRYGYFDDGAREYVITDPCTPVKWINYVGTLAFGGFVDQTGGALICRGDPALNRITRYVAQGPASDFRGTTLYVRIARQEQGYILFSPYFVPTLGEYGLYECHVGLGYTKIISVSHGIRAEAILFVPPSEACLLQDVKITNAADAPVEVDVVPVVEYSHPDALKQLINADWVPQTMQSSAARDDGGRVILLQSPFMNRDRQVNYFTSNLPASSFETDRREFLGRNEYGTWADPLSLHAPELPNTEALRGDNVAALMHHLGTIAPGETCRLVTQLGQAVSLESARPAIERYRDAAQVEAAFDALSRSWEEYLSALQVETPDADANRMLNVHNPRQCHTTANWSRYLSLYQPGYGARGMGFRDSAQDSMGVLVGMPVEAKSLIRKLLHVQRRDGSAVHQFNPLTMNALKDDSAEREDLPAYYGDDHLWVVLAVCAYLGETGDFAFLEERVPFYDKGRDESPLEAGSVLMHLRRAVEFTRNDVGVHGLPLLGFADWNDTVNLRARAESLFTANLYGRALLEMIGLARHIGNEEEARRYGEYYEQMRERVNAVGWDGGWYVRYFDADGTPLGSRGNEHGQIYANAQSWPVISGFATPERARLALDALHSMLNTPNGIKLSTPGFDGFDPRRGGITTYPPGAKENGGIFLHSNPWAIIANAMLGDGDRAFEYYAQINPASKNDRADEFECEPYVYPQNILGDEHPKFGLARNSWLSGTASWMYNAATQYILGVRPTYDGLEIDPCIPRSWHGFRMARRFRGAVYRIEVENPRRICKGVGTVQVDGAAIEGNVVPAFDDGGTHRVRVVMG